MRNLKNKVLSLAAASALALGSLPAIASAEGNQTSKISIPQGTGSAVLDQASYFGDLDPSTQLNVDIVMRVQHKGALKRYIKETATAGSKHYRDYLTVSEFTQRFAPSDNEIQTVTDYLKQYGISSSVYPDNLIITAHGTVAEFNKAFSIDLKKATLNGKNFHASKRDPKAPFRVAHNILTILGLSD
ncbi:MAG TPA: protease pro-enzyme activation domain-containing protein, partial [Bacillales bacterium]|nr:protease pro-enzyme activation domain-containing protein [Bacillales bacterium]